MDGGGFMRRLFLVILFFGSVFSFMHADEYSFFKALVDASKISDPVQRAFAYDAALEAEGFINTNKVNSYSPNTGKGLWDIDVRKSSYSESMNLTAILKSSKYSGGIGKDASLIIGTNDNFLSIYVMCDTVFDSKLPMEYKFNDSESTVISWAVSDDKKAIFYPDFTPDFLEELLKHKEFTIIANQSVGGELRISFDISSMKIDFAKVAKYLPRPDVFLK
jgi:hypothetical protein